MPIRLVALSLIAALATAPSVHAAGAEFLSRLAWHEAGPDHGGFSGLSVYDDGRGFVAITDRGFIAQGTLVRRADAITGVNLAGFTRLLDIAGGPLQAELRGNRQSNQDAEGLARAPDGSLYISFEGVHRVWRFADPTARAQPLAAHRDFRRFGPNAALEALAIDQNDVIYAIPERSGALANPFPVYRLDKKKWRISHHLPRRGRHLPVGADFGPDGKLYLLERDFNGLLGFSSRVRRFTLQPKGRVIEEQVLHTRNLRHGNLEGISVWRDGAGDLRITMIADDNFSIFQTTEIVEYRVTD